MSTHDLTAWSYLLRVVLVAKDRDFAVFDTDAGQPVIHSNNDRNAGRLIAELPVQELHVAIALSIKTAAPFSHASLLRGAGATMAEEPARSTHLADALNRDGAT